VSPASRRQAARHVREKHGLSERRACRLVGLPRSVSQYRSRRVEPAGLRKRMLELASERPRFGCPRIHVLLRREGFEFNFKRIHRIYRQEKLQVRGRRRRRKRAAAAPREAIPMPACPHERWSMDFTSDSFGSGRKFRTLNVVDDFSRKSVAIEVDLSLPGERVARVLDQAAAKHAWPDTIVVDNGPEFTSIAMDQWAFERGVKLHFIDPGKPVQNAFVESFNGKFREECLSENWFQNLEHARRVIAEWRRDYNHVRPHKSLGWRTPVEVERAAPFPPGRLHRDQRSSLEGGKPDRQLQTQTHGMPSSPWP